MRAGQWHEPDDTSGEVPSGSLRRVSLPVYERSERRIHLLEATGHDGTRPC